MANHIAVVAAALIVGAAVVGSTFVDRYQVAAGVDASGAPIAWRLNARTGALQTCGFVVNAGRAPAPVADDAGARELLAKYGLKANGPADDSASPKPEAKAANPFDETIETDRLKYDTSPRAALKCGPIANVGQ